MSNQEEFMDKLKALLREYDALLEADNLKANYPYINIVIGHKLIHRTHLITGDPDND